MKDWWEESKHIKDLDEEQKKIWAEEEAKEKAERGEVEEAVPDTTEKEPPNFKSVHELGNLSELEADHEI